MTQQKSRNLFFISLVSILSLFLSLPFISLKSNAQERYEKANIQVMTLPMSMDKMPKQVRQNFRGYRVIISNMGNTDITIEKARIDNGYSGKNIYTKTRGTVFQRSSLKSLGFSSMKQAYRNRKAKRETLNHPNKVLPGALHSGDFKEVITFVPAGQHPGLYIQYRDNRTGILHEFRKR